MGRVSTNPYYEGQNVMNSLKNRAGICLLVESNLRKRPGDSLRQVLLQYLMTSRVVRWPGTDGLTEDDILDYYPQAIAAGDVPGWHELQRRWPSLAGALHGLRSAKGWLTS
jgi:hypothetical protein